MVYVISAMSASYPKFSLRGIRRNLTNKTAETVNGPAGSHNGVLTNPPMPPKPASLASAKTENRFEEGPSRGADLKFANFVRHNLAIEAKKQLISWPFDLQVKSSVGAENWASVPWLGFFDPLITTSATKGF